MSIRQSLYRVGVTGALAGAAVCAAASVATAAPVPVTDPGGHIAAPGRTAISFEHTPTGTHVGTGNEHESRPAESMVKLYIADYVFAHGTDGDKADATQMLRVSDDNIAARLYAKYPNSIDATAATFGLNDTRSAPHWGDASTSTFDLVKYLAVVKKTNPGSPVLAALATASPVAADGYAQNYGTAVLPGVIGTKWGWSDDRKSSHISASFGEDFAVAAHTYGPAAQLTADVLAAFTNPAPAPGTPERTPGSSLVNPFAEQMPLVDAVTAIAGDIPGLSSVIPNTVTVPRVVVDALTGHR
ncbi:hypothetical protein [Prescottella agglutinans]|uniref:Serine hydrolase n=1 Tax=Prescottella agglutinans TaxID=1644129 RepID=A0ABT6MJC8_9NOCA|nr:hypothetical protein [Prescottella agglutinans]MDH6284335.1 hypothetical protein [Prescottella agglutinans]